MRIKNLELSWEDILKFLFKKALEKEVFFNLQLIFLLCYWFDCIETQTNNNILKR